MKIRFDNIVLRDYKLSDIEDEIRWTNEDNEWFFADTPWLDLEKLAADEFRKEMS